MIIMNKVSKYCLSAVFKQPTVRQRSMNITYDRRTCAGIGINIHNTQLTNNYYRKMSTSTSSTNNNNNSTTKAFNRSIKTIQKSNLIKRDDDQQKQSSYITQYSYFHAEIASRLIDRLDDILRNDGFPLALDIGSKCGYLVHEIQKEEGFPMGGIGGVRKVVMMDTCHELLHYDLNTTEKEEGEQRCSTYKLVGDEEEPLPFPNDTFDLVLSSTSMHWVNNLPALLQEIHRVLKPDGCFLFAMIGGTTLHELNTSLNIGELEREGGVSTHCGPFVNVSDVGSLLSNAGYTLTTVDVDTVKIGYPNAMVLMEHLQRMGENNVCLNRRNHVSVDTFLAAACIYDEMYPLIEEVGDKEEKSVEATAQVIYGIGWVPHESQPKPKKRGSAKHRFGDVVVEETLGQTK